MLTCTHKNKHVNTLSESITIFFKLFDENFHSVPNGLKLGITCKEIEGIT